MPGGFAVQDRFHQFFMQNFQIKIERIPYTVDRSYTRKGFIP
ncbi:hypothetical protein FLA_3147 [Filimonas lacunae]|nr:hypothetical protein FLA_3147 [Filimonas lacunae]